MTLTAVPAIHPTEEVMPPEGPQHPKEVVCPVKPCDGFVCIVRERRATMTKGGLLLPEKIASENAHEQVMQESLEVPLPGWVCAVGGPIENIETPCHRGDRVLLAGPTYSTYEGEHFNYELLTFSAISAVVDPEPED